MNELALPDVNEKGLTAVERARALVILSNEDYQAADSFCASLKDMEKEVDTAFDEHIEAAYRNHKALVAKKKKYAEPIQEARGLIKNKLKAWEDDQERLRQKEEARQREIARKEAEDKALREAEDLEAAGDKEGAQEAISAPVATPTVVVPKTTPKRTTQVRMVKKFRIKSVAAIKRDFLTPDLVKIGQIVRSMGQAAEGAVGGIEVYEEVA